MHQRPRGQIILAKQPWTEDHPILLNGMRVLEHTSQTIQVVVKEAICI